HVVRADGNLARLTRPDELFSLVLGGYGLFSVIVEAKLRVVPNAAYVASHFVATKDTYVETFAREAKGENVGIAFGRLSFDPDSFLDEALLTVYRIDPAAKTLPPVADRETSELARLLFRGEVESDYGKRLRWKVEKNLGNEGGAQATRNQLLREPI